VVPTTDFLHYMSQCLPLLDSDETLIGATAWNENGRFLSQFLDTLICRTFSWYLLYTFGFLLLCIIKLLHFHLCAILSPKWYVMCSEFIKLCWLALCVIVSYSLCYLLLFVHNYYVQKIYFVFCALYVLIFSSCLFHISAGCFSVLWHCYLRISMASSGINSLTWHQRRYII